VSGFRQTGARTIADGGFAKLDEVTIEAPDGSTATRLVLRLPSAVGVVPIDGEDVLLIEQYRAPLDRPLLEIPAGMLDVPGEDGPATAHRELEEEIGVKAGEVTHLIDIVTSPGTTDEIISLYVARGLEPVVRRPEGIEEHHAKVVRMSMAEALAQVRSGRIRDAKSIVGLLLAAER
jgi:8-oxo-dGTP pyrophosphatase MutT (NUDIX family)